MEQSGSILVNHLAEGPASQAGLHVLCPTLVAFLFMLVLHCFSQASYSCSGKPLKYIQRCLISSLLIGCSIAWQPTPKGLVHPTHEDGPISELDAKADCNESQDTKTCKVSIDLKGKIGVKSGHKISFKVISKEGRSYPASITVRKSVTLVDFSADVVMPNYDLAHAMVLDKSEDDKYDEWTDKLPKESDLWSKLGTGNGTLLGLPKMHTDQVVPMFVEERRIDDLAEKWKCGMWTGGSLNMKQVYSAVPSMREGYILWVPTTSAQLNLTICLDMGQEKCHSQTFGSNEVIEFETEDFTFKLDRGSRPSTPVMPNLLSHYILDEHETLRLDRWKIVRKGLRGSMSLYDVGGLQSSCVPTETAPCKIGHFGWDNIVNWEVSSTSMCTTRQDGVITTIIIGAIVAAGITGAALGITDHYAKCNICSVKQLGVNSPDWQDKLANNYASAEDLYLNLMKEFPKYADMFRESDNSKYAQNIAVGLVDFEDIIGQVSFKTPKDVEITSDHNGKISSVLVSRCTLNLAGGMGHCEAEVSCTEEGEYYVYSNDGITEIVTSMVHLERGGNVIEIGVKGGHGRSSMPTICFGELINNKCGQAHSVDIVTNPGITTDDPNRENVKNKISTGEWSFPDLWKILTQWYNKVLLVLLIVASVVFGLVFLTMCYRLGMMIYWMCKINGAKAEVIKLSKYKTTKGVMEVVLMRVDGVQNWGYTAVTDTDYVRFRPKSGLMIREEFDKVNVNDQQVPDVLKLLKPYTCGSGKWLGPHIPMYGLSSVNTHDTPGFTFTVGTKSLPVMLRRGMIQGKLMIEKNCSASDVYSQKGKCKDFFVGGVLSNEEVETNNFRWARLGYYMTSNTDLSLKKKEFSRRRSLPTVDERVSSESIADLKCDGPLIPGLFGYGEDPVMEIETDDENIHNYIKKQVSWDTVGHTFRCLDNYTNGDDRTIVMYEPKGQNFSNHIRSEVPSDCDGGGLMSKDMNATEMIQELEETAEMGFLYRMWWNDVWIIDHRLNGRLVYRGIYDGLDYYINKKPFAIHPSLKHDTLVPLLMIPVANSYRLNPMIILTMLNGKVEELTEEEMNHACAVVAKAQGVIKWVSMGSGSMISCLALCRHCVFNNEKKAIHAYNAEMPNTDTGCHFYNGQKATSSTLGPLSGSCLCLEGTALCVREDMVALISQAPCITEKWGGHDLSIYRGSYGCGSTEPQLDIRENKIYALGEMMVTNTSWDKFSLLKEDEELKLRGEIKCYGGGVIHEYEFHNAEGKDCENIKEWVCAWDNHKKLLLVLGILPAALLIALILMAIVRKVIKMIYAARKARLGGMVTGMADRIMGNPAETLRRRYVMNTLA